jgi:hypothetical protein
MININWVDINSIISTIIMNYEKEKKSIGYIVLMQILLMNL